MKIFNLKNVIAVLALVAFLAACNESSTPTSNNNTGLAAPTNLMALSKDANTVTLKWTASTDESNSAFDHYIITVSPGVIANKTVNKGVTTVDIGSLQEGTPYTFTIKSVNTSNTEGTGATVQWAPAGRYTTSHSQTIVMYEYASSYGSGLQLYSAADQGPTNRKASEKSLWNLGIDTQNGKLLFGSASQISFGTGTPSQKTEIADSTVSANSLDSYFRSSPLNIGVGTYSESLFDLTNVSATNGIIFFVRTSSDGGTTWNYAKVLLKSIGGAYLQPSQTGSNNRYIVLEISYQGTAGVPYAKH